MDKIGFLLVQLFIWIDLGRVQDIIPGLKYTKPGFVLQIALFAVVLANLGRIRWRDPIVIFRILMIAAIIPGIFFGFGSGMVRMIFKFELQRFFSGFLAALAFIRNAGDVHKTHESLVWLAFILALYTIAHGGRGPGLLGDENDIALFLVMLLPFPYLRIAYETVAWRRAAMLGIFILVLAGIGSTLSRGGMVGTLPTLGFIWIKSRRKALTLGLLVVILALTVLFGPEKLISEFRTIGDTQESTASSRIYYWKLSVELMQLHPLFGVGAHCWGNAVWHHISTGDLINTHRLSNMTPHSVYFQVISELGLFGTLCWLGMIASLCHALFRIRKTALDRQLTAAMGAVPDPETLVYATRARDRIQLFGTCSVICLLGYSLSGAFLSVLFYPMLYFFGALILAARTSWERELVIIHNLAHSSPPKTADSGGHAA